MRGHIRVTCAAAVVAAATWSVLVLPAGPAWADDVKMFKTAPSVEELEKALGSGRGAKVKTRSIQFDDGTNSPPAQPQAQPAAAAPAQSYQPAAPQQAPVRPAPQQTNAPPQGTQVQVSEQAVGFPINFDLGSAEIRRDSEAFLVSIAGLLQKDSSMRLLIEGHTDASGNYMRNLDLSRGRAFAVMNYLVGRHGIAPQRLQAIGKGPTEPLDASNPYSAENRRVQFRIIGG